MEDYSISDILYEVSDWLINNLLTPFRRFLVSGDSVGYKRFFFIAIPIFFALIEVIFDFLIPTFLDLQPLGIRRFFVGKPERFKVSDLKSYQPIKNREFKSSFNFRFDKFRFYKHKDLKNNLNFNLSEQKKYILMYQQKYNTTPTPVQLQRFYYSEVKDFNKKPDQFVSNQGVKKNIKGFTSWGEDLKSFIKDHRKKDDRKEVTGFR